MPSTKETCVSLRMRGLTLGEIVQETGLPKTTVYYHIADIFLPAEMKKRIQRKSIEKAAEANRKRKGKCWKGREIVKPTGWSRDLLFLTSHFMFDGEIKYGHCIYQNRSIDLVFTVMQFMEDIFDIVPYYKFYKETGVHRISYHHVELASYFMEKAEKLLQRIKDDSMPEKKIFLKAFFDDEGCIYLWKNARKVRGYQHDLKILKLIQTLLKDFDIESRIDEKYKEIVISRKENLVKFRDKINFSKSVYINPDRKNSIWKQKLEKREILNKAINSYLT